VLQVFEGDRDLHEVRLGRRLALLAGDEVGDRVRFLHDQAAQGAEVPAALTEGQRLPARERGVCPLEGRLRLLAVEQRRLRERLARRRADGRAHAPTGDFAAADPRVVDGPGRGLDHACCGHGAILLRFANGRHRALLSALGPRLLLLALGSRLGSERSWLSSRTLE
jgi:hypothetical protein